MSNTFLFLLHKNKNSGCKNAFRNKGKIYGCLGLAREETKNIHFKLQMMSYYAGVYNQCIVKSLFILIRRNRPYKQHRQGR